MKVISCPKTYIKQEGGEFSIFLAGGITGAPDWQAQLTVMLDQTNYAVINPRRADFPINDTNAAAYQIKWEFAHLRRVDMIVFWFRKETLQPITLYELGAWSMTQKPLVVGIEPGYERELDVEVQTALVRPDVVLLDSLEELAKMLVEFDKHLRTEQP